MPFNGSGQFNLLYNWQNDAAQGLNISSSRMQNQDADLASGLSNCLTKDGQQQPVANIPMAGFRLTNMGNATQQGNAVTVQDVQNGSVVTLTAVAGTDTITANTSPAIGAYASGQTFRFISAGTNTTTTPTLNINGLGAKNITKFGSAAPIPGDIPGAAVITVTYDGTQFELVSARPLGTIQTKAANYTSVPATDYDNVIVFIAAGDYQLQTAAASGAGWKTTIVNGSTFAAPAQVRILRSSTDTIDQDSATVVYVLPGEAVEIRGDGNSKWRARGRTPKGRVINVASFSDNGSTNTSTSPTNAQAVNFTYQPISPNSLLQLQWSFQGNIANLASTNTAGSFTGYEVTSGNTALGAVYDVSAPSSAGGIGTQSPCVLLVNGLANAALAARIFALFQQTNTASAAVSALAIKCEIREIQNA